MKNRKTKKREKRPKLDMKTQINIWTKAGGRCEFKGCNKLLWRDNLTFTEGNYSNIAHIVAVSPAGPRGDKTISEEKVKDISNLMLLCLDHHKLIDDSEGEYTVEVLKQYKEEHEKRIEYLTSLQDDMKTTILTISSNIGGRKVGIDTKKAFQAVKPKYPADAPIEIDLSSLNVEEDKDYYNVAKKIIDEKMNSIIIPAIQRGDIRNLSIFGIASIPLLIYLGNRVGDTIDTDLYQHHRDTQDWKWKDVNDETIQEYSTYIPEAVSGEQEIILKLSLSGRINHDIVIASIGKKLPSYEISIDEPSVEFLKYQNQITEYRSRFLEIISAIRDNHSSNCRIHLFSAIPAPIAIETGRSLLERVEPKFIVYEFDKGSKHYYKAIEV
ncbi:SAVED domain-containing protein [bacterium]|nr:SAVED domain-containing protein [bacterium]